jgi:asparagine synthase (glutamine-hydrolysing)
MCGVACVLGEYNNGMGDRTLDLLKHRGPNDNGVYKGNNIALLHTRLSILDISAAGHQPMVSSCGRYIICFNGEIYNHLELRKKYLGQHNFRGDSDTETILELFRQLQEKMLAELVGMWALFIWDTVEERLFISRDRYGQKPLYYKHEDEQWFFASEIKPLLAGQTKPNAYHATALTEFLALGNYGHLGDATFFRDVRQFPRASYSWLKFGEREMQTHKYWELPFVAERDKRPFDERFKKELHDVVVEAVLSQTISDVPIGITLSGGIDSSIIAGILATHYDKNINIFTAQAVGTPQDESKYVDAVIAKYPEVTLHKKDLKHLSIREDIYKYVAIQEEPFGDPSIIAHGSLMQMAAEDNIKVILGGQGADELFFGYTNMVGAILLKQFRSAHFSDFLDNVNKVNAGKTFLLRTLLLSTFPGIERKLRKESRSKRRDIIIDEIVNAADDSLLQLPRYDDIYGVWNESIYGIHLPHLVHYDDRNAMSYSIEGRMPFLDHRIAELIASIQPQYLYRNGLRKYPLREACSSYIPDLVLRRTDKIGFYTPLITAIYNDAAWIADQLKDFIWIKNHVKATLLQKMHSKTLVVADALLIWRFLVSKCWADVYNINT